MITTYLYESKVCSLILFLIMHGITAPTITDASKMGTALKLRPALEGTPV